MLGNYLKITLRHLGRHKGYAVINVTGLAIGLACCLLIALYVQHERSYDRFHEKADRVYRVVADAATNGELRSGASTQGILAPTLKQEVPVVLEAVRLFGITPVLRAEDRQFQEDDVLCADRGFFEVFSFPLRRGDPETALAEPNTIVLTEETARRYFGAADPMGRTLTSASGYTLTVTGILGEVPAPSHFTFDALVSMATIERDGPDWLFNSWFSFNLWTYVLLPEGSERAAAALEDGLAALVERHVGEEMRQNDRSVRLSLEPLTEIYLHSDRRHQIGPTGNRSNLYTFSFIALFILLLACINFMNLATARSTRRAREVGIRKTVGAHRGQLIRQFLGESVLLSLGAFVLALGLVQIALPFFATLSGKTLHLFARPQDLLLLAGFVLGVGLLAGAYPAFVLSRFRPASVLKGRFGSSGQGALLRKGLVVLQFGISIALLVGTAVVFSQLDYMQRQNLGFDPGSPETEPLLVLPFGGDEQVQQQLDAIKAQFAGHPAVTGVAASQTAPGGGMPQAGGELEDRQGAMQQVSLNLYMVDFDFLDLYGMDVVAGRTFSRDVSGDATEAYLMNETAVRRYGFTSAEEALDRKINLWGRAGHVIGVVRDFHHYALRRDIEPLVMRIDPGFATELSVRLRSDDLPQTLADLEALWGRLIPQRPFDAAFLDERFDAQYRTEVRFGQVFGLFAALAVFIACLGLFGLAAFTAQQRTKEIGIRKVAGASVPQIVLLLSKEFAALVVVAFVLATPFIYAAMNRWLDGFAYRVEIRGGEFLMAGLIALLVALLTVSYQAIRAALTDPVEALRHE